jgi:hypothetical protein
VFEPFEADIVGRVEGGIAHGGLGDVPPMDSGHPIQPNAVVDDGVVVPDDIVVDHHGVLVDRPGLVVRDVVVVRIGMAEVGGRHEGVPAIVVTEAKADAD